MKRLILGIAVCLLLTACAQLQPPSPTSLPSPIETPSTAPEATLELNPIYTPQMTSDPEIAVDTLAFLRIVARDLYGIKGYDCIPCAVKWSEMRCYTTVFRPHGEVTLEGNLCTVYSFTLDGKIENLVAMAQGDYPCYLSKDGEGTTYYRIETEFGVEVEENPITPA